jgi:hypothetical protein
VNTAVCCKYTVIPRLPHFCSQRFWVLTVATVHHITKLCITSPNCALHHQTVYHITKLCITSPNCASHHQTVHHITKLCITSPNCASYHQTVHHITRLCITSPDCVSHHQTVHHITKLCITSPNCLSHHQTVYHITKLCITSPNCALHHQTVYHITHHITKLCITSPNCVSHHQTVYHIIKLCITSPNSFTNLTSYFQSNPIRTAWGAVSLQHGCLEKSLTRQILLWNWTDMILAKLITDPFGLSLEHLLFWVWSVYISEHTTNINKIWELGSWCFEFKFSKMWFLYRGLWFAIDYKLHKIFGCE